MNADPGPILARVGPDEATLEHGQGRVVRIDGEGRWCSLREGPRLWQRCVDGRVVERVRGVARDVERPASVHAAACRSLGRLAAAIRAGRELELSGARAEREHLTELLDRAGVWDPERLGAEAARFARAYAEPVEILPPDRYKDVVLLPATGCPNAACSFCAFYARAPFRVLEPDAFMAHVDAVVGLFGRALTSRTGVFLGSGNALALSDRRLLAVLDVVRSKLAAARGIAAFWDPDHAPLRDAAAWRRLRRAGLARVYPGLETGDAELRARFHKSADVGAFIDAVHVARAAGIAIGVTVLALPDGEASPAHCTATRNVIERLELQSDDIVYVSPFNRGDARAVVGQLAGCTAAKVVPYHVNRFRYYT